AAGSPSRASQAGAACAPVARTPRASAPPTPRPTAARIKLRLVVMCDSTPEDAQCSALASFASAALSLALLGVAPPPHTRSRRAGDLTGVQRACRSVILQNLRGQCVASQIVDKHGSVGKGGHRCLRRRPLRSRWT